MKKKAPKQFIDYSLFNISDGLMIAVITLVAYALKFIYDYSYGLHFDIPFEFTSFNLSSVLPSLFVIVPFLFVCIYMVGLAFHFKEKMNHIQIAYQNLSILLMFSVLAYVIHPEVNYYYIFAVPAAYVALRHFFAPILWHDDKKGYTGKLNEHFKIVIKKTDNAVDMLWNFAMYRRSAYMLTLVGLAVMTSIYGGKTAMSKTDYFVMKSNESQVAVKFIDDKVVFVQIDNNNVLTGNVFVRKIDDKDISLVKKDVGEIIRSR